MGGIVSGIGNAIGSVVGFIGKIFGLGMEMPPDTGSYNSNLLSNATDPTSFLGVVYGRRRKGGVRIAGPFTKGEDNKYLYAVYALSHGEIEDITNPMIDGVPFSSYAIKNFVDWSYGTGAANQDATQDRLIQELGEPYWDMTDGKLQGVAFAVVKLTYNQDDMNSMNNITFDVIGRKVYNPITGVTELSDNPALCALDYQTDPVYGRGMPYPQAFNVQSYIDAANYFEDQIGTMPSPILGGGWLDQLAKDSGYFGVQETLFNSLIAGEEYEVYDNSTGTEVFWFSDVLVSKSYTGIPIFDPSNEDLDPELGGTTYIAKFAYKVFFTKIIGSTLPLFTNDMARSLSFRLKAKRYSCNGNVDTGQNLYDNLMAIATSFNGVITFVNGLSTIIPDRPEPIAMSFDKSNITSDIDVEIPDNSTQLNEITGTWFDPENGYDQMTRTVKSQTFLDRDYGRPQSKEINMPFCNNPNQVDRILNIEINKSRHSGLVKFDTFWVGLDLVVGNVISVTDEELLWANKLFRVLKIGIPDAFGDVSLTCLPYDSEDYIEGGINTRTPASYLAIPTGREIPVATSLLVSKVDSDTVYEVRAQWSAPINYDVDSYILEIYQVTRDGLGDISSYSFFGKYKDIVGSSYNVSGVFGNGVEYEFRLYSVNDSGVRSITYTKVLHVYGKIQPPSDISINIISPWAIEASPIYGSSNSGQVHLPHRWYIARHVDPVNDPEPTFAEAVLISSEVKLKWNGVKPNSTYRLWCQAFTDSEESDIALGSYDLTDPANPVWVIGSGKLAVTPVVTNDDIGVDVTTLTLQSDAQVFSYKSDGTITPSVINFTAYPKNIDIVADPIVFSSVPTVNLSGTGSTRTLTKTDFDALGVESVTVTAATTSGSVSDSITIVKLIGGGADGVTPTVGYLTNEAHTIAADSGGNVIGNLADAGGVFKVFSGTTDVTTSSTFTLTNQTGLIATIGATSGSYSISAVTLDSGYVDLQATYNGVVITKRYTISKSKTGDSGYSSRVDFAYGDYSDGSGNTKFASGTVTAGDYTPAIPAPTSVYLGTHSVSWLTGQTEPAVPTTIADYEWSRFRGDDATEKYTWVVYSDSTTTGTISLTKGSYKYTGVSYNKTAPTPDTTDHNLYSWSLTLDTIDLSDSTLFTNALIASLIDVTDLFAQDILASGSIEASYNGKGAKMSGGTDVPFRIFNGSTDVLSFNTVDNSLNITGKLNGELGSGTITSLSPFTQEVLDQLVPTIAGTTGGTVKATGLPVTMDIASTTVAAYTVISSANSTSVGIDYDFTAYAVDAVNGAGSLSYSLYIKRKVDGGLYTAVFSLTNQTGTTLGDGVAEPLEQIIALKGTFYDSTHGALDDGTNALTYELSVVRNGSVATIQQIKDLTVSQTVQGGGVAGNATTLAGQLPSYYLNWDNFTNTPATLSGYGITDTFTKTESDVRYGKLLSTNTWSGDNTFSRAVANEHSLSTVVDMPAGNYMRLGDNNVGAIEIELPQGWTSTMLSFEVDVYDYDTGESFTVKCRGYTYSAGYWYRTSAVIEGSRTTNLVVRFGHNGVRPCVWIGDTGSTWRYISAVVTKVIARFAATESGRWRAGWTTRLVTAMPTITTTHMGAGLVAGFLQASDGSVLSPSMTFQNDRDTGFYSLLNNNNIGVSCGGLRKLYFSSGPYGLYLESSIQAGNNAINYLSQLHFNNNTWLTADNRFLFVKHANTSEGGVSITSSTGALRGGLYSNDSTGNFGLLNSSSQWFIRNQDSNNYVYLSANGADKLVITPTGASVLGRLSISVETNGYFFSDTAGRTAFTGGSFYIQSGCPFYYNYAPYQYHGNSSGTIHNFRANLLLGDNWKIDNTGYLWARSHGTGVVMSKVLTLDDFLPPTPPTGMDGVITTNYLAAGAVQARHIQVDGGVVDPVTGAITSFKINPESSKPLHLAEIDGTGAVIDDLFFVTTGGNGFFKGVLSKDTVDINSINEEARKAIYPYYLGTAVGASQIYNGTTTLVSGGSYSLPSAATIGGKSLISFKLFEFLPIASVAPKWTVSIYRDTTLIYTRQYIGTSSSYYDNEAGVTEYDTSINIDDAYNDTGATGSHVYKIVVTKDAGSLTNIDLKYFSAESPNFLSNELDDATSKVTWRDKETGYTTIMGSVYVANNSSVYVPFTHALDVAYAATVTKQGTNLGDPDNSSYVLTTTGITIYCGGASTTHSYVVHGKTNNSLG